MRTASLLAVLLLSSCARPAATSGPATPDPPQVRVLKLVQVGAAANDAAAHTLVALCVPSAGAPATVDNATCNQVKVYLASAARTFDQLAAEAAGPDAWPLMRVKLTAIAATGGGTAAVADPTLQAQLASLQAVLRQIAEVQ